MKCPVCGRSEGHCKRCHFVHDHMSLLDGTIASANELVFRPPPWKSGPMAEQKVRDLWESYEVPV